MFLSAVNCHPFLHCQSVMLNFSPVFVESAGNCRNFHLLLYCLAVRFVFLSIVWSVSPCLPDEGGETSPKRRIEQKSAG